MTAEQTPIENFAWNQRWMRFFHRLLAAVMLACLSVPIGWVVYRVLSLQPVGYLPVVVFLVALESMYSHAQMRPVSIADPKRWLYHLAEFLVLIVSTRLLLYNLYGFDRLWVDLPAWRADFFAFFDNPEYLFLVVSVIGVWVLSGEIEDLFHVIEYDEWLLDVELDTGFSEERAGQRQRLANLVIACGGLMVFLTTLLNLQSGGTWPTSVAGSQGVLALVVYFVCGLVLLSLTQFAILRVRWVIDHVPIERRITTRWIGFSLGLILALALLAFLLPTGYSGQILQLLQTGIAYLIFFVQLLIYLLTLPFVLFFSWLMRLFNRQTDEPAPAAPQIYPPPQLVSGEPASWWELAKTVLFWVGLAGLVGYAFFYYFREHPEYFRWLGRSRLLGGLGRLWQRLVGWFTGVNRQAAQVIAVGLLRLRRRAAAPVDAVQSRFANPRRLAPRDQVRFYYLALVRHGARQGIPRSPAQTPNEYSERLKTTIIKPPEAGLPAQNQAGDNPSIAEFEQDLSELTSGFIEARYSQHEISLPQASQARRSWEHILRVLRARS